MSAPWWIVPVLCGLSAVGYIFKLKGETKIKQELTDITKPRYTDKQRKEFYQDFKQWRDVNVQHSPDDSSQVWVFESTINTGIYPLGFRSVATSQWDLIDQLMAYRDKVMENQ